MSSEYLWMLEPGDEWSESRLKWSHSLKSQGSSNYFLPEPQRSSSLTRAYQVGDPIRAIDWRAFARKDEWIVRLEKPESRIRAHYFIDLSESMFYPDRSFPLWDSSNPEIFCSKAMLVLKIAFYSAYLYARMNNTVQIVLFSSGFDQDQDSNFNLDIFRISSNRASEILDFYHELKSMVMRKNYEEFRASLSSFGFFKRKAMELDDFLEVFLVEKNSLDFVLSDALGRENFLEKIFSRSQRSVFYHCLHHTELDDLWMKHGQAFKPAQLYPSFFKGSEFLKDKVLLKSRRIWLDTIQKKYSLEQNLFVYQLLHESMETSILLGDLEYLDV